VQRAVALGPANGSCRAISSRKGQRLSADSFFPTLAEVRTPRSRQIERHWGRPKEIAESARMLGICGTTLWERFGASG